MKSIYRLCLFSLKATRFSLQKTVIINGNLIKSWGSDQGIKDIEVEELNKSLCKNIDWVGYVDWDVRDFHGYQTKRGSTYNSYLVRDRKTALIDAVKSKFATQLISNISDITGLEKIDYVICNHAEPDHSGGLPDVMKAFPNAKLVCNEKCRKTLTQYYDTGNWNWLVVKDGDSISLGDKTLTFINTPMVHWPESMFTYIPEDKLLFSMDAFGQHYASEHRFDDEEPLDTVMHEAKVYYANIVMHLGKQIAKVLERAGTIDINLIAPSHGVIWRKNIGTILSAYQNWVACKAAKKVLIIYSTMWNSTEKMAAAIADGASGIEGVSVKLLSTKTTHITDIATEILDAATVAFGSPTLNMTLMPEMAAALTYLKGLKPANKAGFAFGSYGWAQAGQKDIEEYLKEMNFDVLHEPVTAQYVPTTEVLDECRKAGELLAKAALKA